MPNWGPWGWEHGVGGDAAGLAGRVAGAVPGVRSLTSPRWHDGTGRGAGVCHRVSDHPLAILRLGLALQLAGFVVLVAID